MFERFDNAAKRGVVLAQEHAKEYRSNAVEPEHMALAYLSFHDHFGWLTGVIGFTVEQLSDALAEAMPAIDTDLPKPTEHIRLAPATKEVFERCLADSLQKGNYIGVPHVFIALVWVACQPAAPGQAEFTGPWRRVVEQFGLDYQGLRDAVAVAMPPFPVPPPASPTPPAHPTVGESPATPEPRPHWSGAATPARTAGPAVERWVAPVVPRRPRVSRRNVQSAEPSGPRDHPHRTIMMRGPDDPLRITMGFFDDSYVGAEPFRPVLVLGPQRSRKTTSIAVPSLLEWPGPALVTSVGGDLIEQTIEARRSSGDVMIFDPSGVLAEWPEKVGWSPTELVTDWDSAKNVARALVTAGKQDKLTDSDFWYEAAIQLLSPHLFAAARNGYLMADVVRWIKTQEEFEVRALLQATGEELAIQAAEASWQREERAKSSIYTTLEIAMGVWERASVQRASGKGPRFHLDKFLDGRSNTLYLCAPADEQREFRPILTALTRTIVQRTFQVNRGFAGELLELHGPMVAIDSSAGEVTPLLMVLDDAGSVAPLSDLGSLAGTAAKVAIQLVSIFHDLSQIQAVYGEFAARSIVNNHPALLFFPGSHDNATAELVQRMLADEKVHGSGPEFTGSFVMRRLPRGQALCIYESLKPVVIDLRSSMVDSDLLALRGLDVPDDGEVPDDEKWRRPRRWTT